jgi:hypothetical protein
MRGSGSQFGGALLATKATSSDLLTRATGIVTQFKVITYPIGKVWGGGRMYSQSKRDEVLALVHKLAPHEDHDPKAAIIYTDTIYGSRKRMGYLYVFLFYDAPEPPSAGPLADLLKVPSVISNTKSQTYTELVGYAALSYCMLTRCADVRQLLNNGKGADALPYRYAFRVWSILPSPRELLS